MRQFIIIALACIFSSVLSVFLFTRLVPSGQVSGEQPALTDRLFSLRNHLRSGAPTSFTAAADIATPAVVYIKAVIKTGGGFFSGDAFAGASGSGVILSPDGYVVTNHHVIENSAEIKITLFDKREYKAQVIGSDQSTDIALLKIDENELPFMLLGNSDSVRVGEWVLAVGNPFNLESTVTAGIVSAKGRNINILGGSSSIESFIQTDAAVNPGNSGGALVNTAGELIGVNSAIMTESGSYEGYSFAVPSNLVQKVIRDLKEFGVVQRAYLGIGIQDVDAEMAKELELPSVQGVLVNRIIIGGAASDAGMASGDVILSVNNVRVNSTAELQEHVGRFRPGETVNLEFWRRGQSIRNTVTLKDGNNNTKVTLVRGDELDQDLGISLRDLTREEERKMHVQGAVVTSIRRGSVVYETNMQPGFVICSVNGNRVKDAADAIEAIRNAYNKLVLDGYYEGEPDLYSYRFRK